MLKEIVIGNVRIEYCETGGNLPLDMIITFCHKFNKTCRLSPHRQTHTHRHTHIQLGIRMCEGSKVSYSQIVVYNLGLIATSQPAPALSTQIIIAMIARSAFRVSVRFLKRGTPYQGSLSKTNPKRNTKQKQQQEQRNRESNRTKRNKTNDVERRSAMCGGSVCACMCVCEGVCGAIKSNPFQRHKLSSFPCQTQHDRAANVCGFYRREGMACNRMGQRHWGKFQKRGREGACG